MKRSKFHNTQYTLHDHPAPFDDPDSDKEGLFPFPPIEEPTYTRNPVFPLGYQGRALTPPSFSVSSDTDGPAGIEPVYDDAAWAIEHAFALITQGHTNVTIEVRYRNLDDDLIVEQLSISNALSRNLGF